MAIIPDNTRYRTCEEQIGFVNTKNSITGESDTVRAEQERSSPNLISNIGLWTVNAQKNDFARNEAILAEIFTSNHYSPKDVSSFFATVKIRPNGGFFYHKGGPTLLSGVCQQHRFMTPSQLNALGQAQKELGDLYASIDSSKLLELPKSLDIQGFTPDRTKFITNELWKHSCAPPIVSRSSFVPDFLVEHLMRNKKDIACNVKYREGDRITNLEGAFHSFITPITNAFLTADYAYYDYGHNGRSHHGSGRPIVLSAAVQPDFEFKDSPVTAHLIQLRDQAIEGREFDIENPMELKERDPQLYEQRLLQHAVLHLTADGRLPAKNEAVVIALNDVFVFVGQLVYSSNPAQECKNKAVEINGELYSLEALLNIYVEQLTNEFKIFETMLGQSYIYTIDPPAIFAKSFGDNSPTAIYLFNRLQIAAFQQLKQQGFAFNNLHKIAFNDYADKQAIALLKQVFPDKTPNRLQKFFGAEEKSTVIAKSELLHGPEGRYSGPDGVAYIGHNNSDGFGQNIEFERMNGSLDSFFQHSDAAVHLMREKHNLLQFVV